MAPVEGRVCARCKTHRPAAQFYADPRKSTGLSSWCRPCYVERNKERYSTPEGRATILAKNRVSAHKYKGRYKDRYKRMRLDMIEAYGGECACCGVTEPEFLTIDHIFNDGAEERAKNSLTGARIFMHLRNLGYPKDRYQLLCFNCNCAKGIHGECPHVKARVAA